MCEFFLRVNFLDYGIIFQICGSMFIFNVIFGFFLNFQFFFFWEIEEFLCLNLYLIKEFKWNFVVDSMEEVLVQICGFDLSYYLFFFSFIIGLQVCKVDGWDFDIREFVIWQKRMFMYRLDEFKWKYCFFMDSYIGVSCSGGCFF